MQTYLGAMGLLSSNGALFNKVVHPFRRGLRDVTGLFLPRHCAGCDEALMAHEHALCSACLEDLPRTRFHNDPANPVERVFWGRVELAGATAFLYFDKRGKVQRLLHRLKYKGDREVGLELGRRLGSELKESTRFRSVDAVMAVPLHRRKERERGYNQSEVLAEGIREAMGIGPGAHRLSRVVHTASQTRKGRIDRWLNVKDAFELIGKGPLEGRHVLLVDDVVTTGATLEGCITTLRAVPGVTVSVATVAFA
jgi:ComF family protein